MTIISEGLVMCGRMGLNIRDLPSIFGKNPVVIVVGNDKLSLLDNDIRQVLREGASGRWLPSVIQNKIKSKIRVNARPVDAIAATYVSTFLNKVHADFKRTLTADKVDLTSGKPLTEYSCVVTIGSPEVNCVTKHINSKQKGLLSFLDDSSGMDTKITTKRGVYTKNGNHVGTLWLKELQYGDKLLNCLVVAGLTGWGTVVAARALMEEDFAGKAKYKDTDYVMVEGKDPTSEEYILVEPK